MRKLQVGIAGALILAMAVVRARRRGRDDKGVLDLSKTTSTSNRPRPRHGLSHYRQ
jgi:hypothetical protein